MFINKYFQNNYNKINYFDKINILGISIIKIIILFLTF